MYNKELTLNIDNVFGNIVEITNTSFYGFSFAKNGNKLIINCDPSQKLEDRAEKYVALFESNSTAETLRDARYMV